MSLTFEDWLIAQYDREDFIGDFARGLTIEELDLKSKKAKHNEHAKWVNVVIEMQQQEYVTIFNIAWQEFLLEKAAVEAALEQEEASE